ncbi:MAG: hypothetical protein ACKVJ9_08280 [Cytophagales bacterium]|jgi:hypothetical protein|tara:strand:+ start:1226 stop:1942 length:717 start_codon:yes stop_codon:yes gene_type:complete
MKIKNVLTNFLGIANVLLTFIFYLVKNRSFSQLGEDLVIKNQLQWAGYSSKEKGAYVDIGCYHPLDGSNTYIFYRKGSSGIVVDIGKSKKLLFNIFRRRDKFINSAVVPDSMANDSFKFVTTGYGSKTDQVEVSEGYDPEHSVNVIGISALLESGKRYLFKSWSILSIDAEGMDQSIVESINFDDYPFTIVAFENFFDDPCEKIKSAIGNSTHVYLTSYGYILQSICGPTYIYIKYKR